MKIFVFDGTADGFFTAVFEAYAQKVSPRFVCGDFQPDFESEVLRIPVDLAKAERVRTRLRQIGGDSVLRDLSRALCAGLAGRGDIAFGYVRELLKHGRDARDMLACPAVIDFRELVQKVNLEVHRFKGFLRLQETAAGVFYARYEPDHDITALLLPHFRARYNNEKFLIHDIRRNVLGIYDGKNAYTRGYDKELKVYLAETEESFQRMFALYYRSVNIEARKNLRQMFSYMPRRYHKHLPERAFHPSDFEKGPESR